MNRDRITQNLAAVENHFQSETLNKVEAALETFTDLREGSYRQELPGIDGHECSTAIY